MRHHGLTALCLLLLSWLAVPALPMAAEAGPSRGDARLTGRDAGRVPEILVREQSERGLLLVLPGGTTSKLFRLGGDRWVLDLAGARWPSVVGDDTHRAGRVRIRLGMWRPAVARLVLVGHGPQRPVWSVVRASEGLLGRLDWSGQSARVATPVPHPARPVPVHRDTPLPGPTGGASAPSGAPSPSPPIEATPSAPQEGRDEVRVAPSPGVTLRRAGPLWLVRLTADGASRFRLARRGQRNRVHVAIEGGKVPMAASQAFADGPFSLRVEAASGSVAGTHVVLQWPLGYRYEALQTADGQALVLGFLAPGRARGRQLRITVDAGHGGSDPGTRSVLGEPEKIVAFALAQALERALERRGVQVQATRRGDETLSLHGRVDMGEEFRSDALVSIHLNHAGRSSTRGIETYWYTPGSVALARSVQRRLVAALGAPDRGVHRENFVVVKYGRFPACLVEVGYLSHPEEARLLRMSEYQRRAAEGMAAGILDALAPAAAAMTPAPAPAVSGTRPAGRAMRRGGRAR